ncbi:MAG TPA: VTT domain-containing protein [Rugosimonospora sp.]|nr:VTT domain-containing protein [Rugosimonospora sp.]
MGQIADVLGHLPTAVIYFIGAVLAGGETATLLGLVLPGELTLVVVGFLCYGGRLQLAIALPIMVTAGLVGDNLGYLAGRRAGPRLRTGGLGRWVGERRWVRAERMFDRYGGRAVFLARFLGFARTLVPRLAGTTNLAYRRFLPWNAVGVVGCVIATVLVGYLAGDSYAQVADVFGQATGALLLLLLVIVAIVLVGRYLGRHPQPVAAVAGRLLGWPPLTRLARRYQRGFAYLSRRLGVGGAVAVNVLGGMLALLAVGYGLSWAVEHLVRHSGLPLIDPTIVRWMAARHSPRAVDLATDTCSLLRAKSLVILVGLVAVALNWRSRSWREDLVGVLGTVGAFVPLMILGIVTDWVGRPAAEPVASVFPNQTAIVTASLGMLAWLISRRAGWRLGVAAWLSAVAGALLVGLARVYLGWSWPSESVASVLLGWLWVLVFVIAWRTRDRIGAPDTRPDDSMPAADTDAHRAGV